MPIVPLYPDTPEYPEYPELPIKFDAIVVTMFERLLSLISTVRSLEPEVVCATS